MSLRTWFRDWLNAPSKQERLSRARASERSFEVFKEYVRDQKARDGSVAHSMRSMTVAQLLAEEVPDFGHIAGGEIEGHPADPFVAQVDAQAPSNDGPRSE